MTPVAADQQDMRWWLGWVAAGAVAIAGYFLVPQDSVPSNIYYDVLAVVSALAIAVGVRLHRPARALMWYLLSAGQLLWSLGDITYGVIKFGFGRDSFPSESDVVYLAGYPVMAAALFVLIRGRTSGRDRAGLFDASIIATGLTLVVWTFIMRAVPNDQPLPASTALLDALHLRGRLLISMIGRS